MAYQHRAHLDTKKLVKVIVIVVVVMIILPLVTNMYKIVPVGHVAVATLFGKARPDAYEEGLHFPVNPFYSWYEYDVRRKTHKEKAMVPSQDQLTTDVEFNIQFRLIRKMAPRILQETGGMQDVVNVHIVPKLRSLIREQGKSIEKAEDFFKEDTQQRLQKTLLQELMVYLQPKGVEIEAVLIRDMKLPPFIIKAIESKKEREQAVEKQKAELERFKTEQEQKVAAAEAERRAAEEEAQKKRVLAEARAYEIEKITEAVKKSPAYIQLEALKTLGEIAKDPATKIYFIDPKGSKPLPLMHIGTDSKK